MKEISQYIQLFVTCNLCNGEGKVEDLINATFNNTRVGYKSCPDCNGSGVAQTFVSVKKIIENLSILR